MACLLAYRALTSGVAPAGQEQSDIDQWSVELRRADSAQQFDQVVALADRILTNSPSHDTAMLTHYVRGRAQFCLGQQRKSLEDFDRVVQLDPARERQLWERGIVYYYLGQFAQGSRQFELYQTFHDQDVENSVWRYLCQAHVVGRAAARRQMLPIERDRRVPMMEIYHLFRGEKTPDEVLAAAESPPAAGVAPLSDQEPNDRRFYAHLYLGLYYESENQPDQSRQHIHRAVHEFDRQRHYMWWVAQVHERIRSTENAVKTSDEGQSRKP